MPSETKFIVLSLIISLVLVIGAVFFISSQSSNSNQISQIDPSLLIKTDSYKVGSDSAKIQIVEFADFACPACRATQPVINQIKEEYKDQLLFVFRHFPLPQHVNAIPAALASEAAGEQGKFFEYVDLLYQNQGEWAAESDPKELFIGYASQLGLDTQQFETDLANQENRVKINRDLSDANSLGVNSTPTVFLNNQRVQNLNYENLKQAIEQELQN